ncbi:thioredoxin [Sphingobacterium sp. Ag1]|uniref:thioredoxin family protein n=1 Tax=Sphingobacterium sp. Ag1 TaxID=1643451 RepID=UPI0006278867|nr:thioredoxin family protein [Sphingobacterium sp. Ag1]KKO92437.1 thioredoxin [Sphingobacterium sp. Ag1]
MKNEMQDTAQVNNLELLQFYAEWCQPCKMMMPIVELIKQKSINWLTVKQIDVDENSELSGKYQIRSIPTFVVLKNNEEIWRKTGMLSEHAFLDILKSLDK